MFRFALPARSFAFFCETGLRCLHGRQAKDTPLVKGLKCDNKITYFA